MATRTKKKASPNKPKRRVPIPPDIRQQVLIECGYICANPGCRFPIFEVHHIIHVEEGGPNTADNLLALCPLCHTRVHKGEIPRTAVQVWKLIVVAASRAWSKETLNSLLFLDTPLARDLFLTGDGIIRFSDLIVAGLAIAEPIQWVGNLQAVMVVKVDMGNYAMPASELAKRVYKVKLTKVGAEFVKAWKQGDLPALSALGHSPAALN